MAARRPVAVGLRCRSADCRATWSFDDETPTEVWEAFASAPELVGYDPSIIPAWSEGPTSPAFAVLRLEPWRLRVLPGSVVRGEGGDVRNRA